MVACLDISWRRDCQSSRVCTSVLCTPASLYVLPCSVLLPACMYFRALYSCQLVCTSVLCIPASLYVLPRTVLLPACIRLLLYATFASLVFSLPLLVHPKVSYPGTVHSCTACPSLRLPWVYGLPRSCRCKVSDVQCMLLPRSCRCKVSDVQCMLCNLCTHADAR
jgi:hypothetical protein